jgi:hypothetical protein
MRDRVPLAGGAQPINPFKDLPIREAIKPIKEEINEHKDILQSNIKQSKFDDTQKDGEMQSFGNNNPPSGASLSVG